MINTERNTSIWRIVLKTFYRMPFMVTSALLQKWSLPHRTLRDRLTTPAEEIPNIEHRVPTNTLSTAKEAT
jgi:hypothetical protein